MRLIDADAFDATMYEAWVNCEITNEEWFHFREMIKDEPTVKPHMMRGKWIRNDNGTYSCSVCHSWVPEEQHYYARYCLHCGADMRG